MIGQETVDIVISALCCWREARGEVEAAKLGVLCVLRNRVRAQWISDNNYQDCACHRWQFSGMTATGDPNLAKWPASDEGAWMQCLILAEQVVTNQVADVTGGSEYYHDISLPSPPPGWGTVLETARIGRLIFYRGI